MALCKSVIIERTAGGFEVFFSNRTLCAGCSLLGGDSRAGVSGKDVLVIFQEHLYRSFDARRLIPQPLRCRAAGETGAMSPASLLVAGDEGSFGGELARECGAWSDGRSPQCPSPAVLRQLNASVVLEGPGTSLFVCVWVWVWGCVWVCLRRAAPPLNNGMTYTAGLGWMLCVLQA